MGRRSVETRAVDRAASQQPIAASTLALLQTLPLEWIAVGPGFSIEASSARAADFGLVRAGALSDRKLRAAVTAALRSPEAPELELDLGGAARGAAPRQVRVRATAVGVEQVILLIEDLSHPLRVDAMRRDFIVNVSHELKTPVGALLLLAEAIKASTDDRETLLRFVDRLQTESERLSRLINDLTDLSRLQASEPAPMDHAIGVDRLFAEATDTVRLLAHNRDIDIVIGDARGVTVRGDEEQLVTALRNLLTNAITYSPTHTRVRITARVVDGFAELSVSDQGLGIDTADQERIFERFYRVDPARSRATGGTGLGLAIVKHICTAHGGECLVWSQPGEGSTFTLRLPHATAASTSDTDS